MGALPTGEVFFKTEANNFQSRSWLPGSTAFPRAQWVAAGDEHCVIPYDRFWWRRAADGTALSAWLQRMVDGEAVASVDCGGEACLVGVEQ